MKQLKPSPARQHPTRVGVHALDVASVYTPEVVIFISNSASNTTRDNEGGLGISGRDARLAKGRRIEENLSAAANDAEAAVRKEGYAREDVDEEWFGPREQR